MYVTKPAKINRTYNMYVTWTNLCSHGWFLLPQSHTYVLCLGEDNSWIMFANIFSSKCGITNLWISEESQLNFCVTIFCTYMIDFCRYVYIIMQAWICAYLYSSKISLVSFSLLLQQLRHLVHIPTSFWITTFCGEHRTTGTTLIVF